MRQDHSQWIKKIREHARDHYEEGGWDYVEECWSDEDLEGIFFRNQCSSYGEAFANVKEITDLFGDRRSEVEATIW